MNARKRFNDRIKVNYPNSEIASIVDRDEYCGFYEVCQKFLDVSLNAPKVKTPDGKIAGIFQYADIAVAKEATIDFIKKWGIKDLDSIFNIIGSSYSYSSTPDDKRQKSGVLGARDTVASPGYAGTLYMFTKINNDVYQKIVNEIRAEI